MAAHKHADLMALYAEDAKKTETPWAQWEFRQYSKHAWEPMTYHPGWSVDSKYRRKPQKKIMWQWIYDRGGSVFLTRGFYPSKKAAEQSFDRIIGPAEWTRIEVDE